MSATATATRLPAGTWKVDPTHSSATFAVKHMAVGTFRGGFEDLDAALIVSEDGAATLQGTVRADSINVKDENLLAHLGSQAREGIFPPAGVQVCDDLDFVEL